MKSTHFTWFIERCERKGSWFTLPVKTRPESSGRPSIDPSGHSSQHHMMRHCPDWGPPALCVWRKWFSEGRWREWRRRFLDLRLMDLIPVDGLMDQLIAQLRSIIKSRCLCYLSLRSVENLLCLFMFNGSLFSSGKRMSHSVVGVFYTIKAR